MSGSRSKDVLVVVGVGGMGQAIARRLGNGRAVLLGDVDEQALARTADVLRAEGHDVTQQAVDVTDVGSIRALAKQADALGRVTQVAHTAGLSPVQASTEAVLQVDLLGVALVLEEFESVVASGGAGLVVASMAGHLATGITPELAHALATTPAAELLALPALAPDVVGDPGTAYSLAKRANVLRVQAAASAWGQRGARLNSVSPGVISTPMGQQELAGENGDHMRALVAISASGRVGTPDDIACAAAFLLGPDAAFVTGTDLLVDGGAVAAIRALLPVG